MSDRRIHLASEFGEPDGFVLKFPTSEALREKVKDTFLIYRYLPSPRAWWVSNHDSPALVKFAMDFDFAMSTAVLEELRVQSQSVLALKASQAHEEHMPKYERRELEGDDRPAWAKKYWKVVEFSYVHEDGTRSVSYIRYLEPGTIEGAPKHRA